MSEYATAWLVSLLRRLGYRRAILQSDGEPSSVALKTATLLAAPFVELVLRQSPVGEHATNGVAESAVREEADTNAELSIGSAHGKGLRVPFHLEVDTDDGIRCHQFLQDWQRWLDC